MHAIIHDASLVQCQYMKFRRDCHMLIGDILLARGECSNSQHGDGTCKHRSVYSRKRTRPMSCLHDMIMQPSTLGFIDCAFRVKLVPFSVRVVVLDDRPDQTYIGQTNGLLAMAIEMLQQLGLAASLIRQDFRIQYICMHCSKSSVLVIQALQTHI
ncbi:hypothetical protein K461DRAFT_173285 [Myriangium duriaei CBS 260.36]|uniref:Uncharacterized protein n=1 Tax=Myriangium duriaei CBS 260.36 TaxID=1168546 RepID=A0A9P4J0Z2_9PEZI|nr:hypothetical protein K461DRAFT_173285 [Myriangium duriaei CBS 260.36]